MWGNDKTSSLFHTLSISLQNSLDQVGRRCAIDEGQAQDLAACRLNLFTSDDGFQAPVAPVHQHIGNYCGDYPLRRQVVKARHIIYTTERGHYFCAFIFVQDRTSFAFQLTNAAVAVERDD